MAAALALALSTSLSVRPAAADLKDDCAEAAEQGQALMRAGKLAQARPQLVSCARPVCPRVVRTDCAPWLVELDRMMPSFVVRARDERGRDVIVVRVVVDGHSVADRLDGSAVSIDPGEHVLRFEVAGAPATEERILLAQGEKNRVVSASLHAALNADGSRVDVPAPTPQGHHANLVPTFVLGGVGLVALGVFAGLEVSAQQDKSRLDGGCGRTGSCAPGQVDPVRTQFDAAGISLGIGLAALGVATVLLLVATKGDAGAAAPARAQTPGVFRF